MTDFHGPEINRRCLGTMFFGTLVPAERSYAVLDHYLESGGRMIDTANNYAAWVEGGTGNESETLLGRWIAERGNRESLYLASKIGARSADGTHSPDAWLGLSAAAVRDQVLGSLGRLGVERLDLVYAHVDDRSTPLEETLGAFDALVREGLVGEIACSNYTGPRLQAALEVSAQSGLARYQADQLRISYLTPSPGHDLGVQILVDEQSLDVARRNDVTLFGYSTLLAGAYAGRGIPDGYQHSRTQAQLAALDRVAAGLGITANQTVLAWLVAQQIVPVLGVSRIEQLDEALAGLDIALSAEAMAELDAARR